MITTESNADEAGRLAGGKGRSLYELSRNGFAVPRWAVIGADVFGELLERKGVRTKIDRLLSGLTETTVDETAGKIADLLSKVDIDTDIEAMFEGAYRHVGGGRVAVRSSGVEEDGERLSFAGQFETRLNVRGLKQLHDSVVECWISAFSARSLAYRLGHGIAVRVLGMAVVVQEMVDAQRSGVLFTVNPLSASREQCVVSSVYGLGEGLVSGLVDADTVVLDKATGDVVETVVGDKAEKVEAASESGCHVREVSAELRKTLALQPKDLSDLHELGSRVEEVFGCPQDIEWAIDHDRLWILQSRPVTSPVAGAPATPTGELRIWDNSNIIESFSGITSPLTYSFAADAYAKVYRNYAQALRVPRAQLRQLDDWLPSMLGYFHGRVYYNLFHWYRIVRMAPGYPLTRRVLEVSLGVEEPLSNELANGLHPFTFRTSFARRSWRALGTAEFARRFLTMDRDVERFVKEFYERYRVFDNVDYDALPATEIYRRFRDLERDLLEKWGPMMTLDAAILMSFGALHLLTKKWLPGAPEWFQWAVVSPGEDVESAEPARALSRLAETVRADAQLRELITSCPPERAGQALADAGHDGFLAEIDEYIDEYGYRSPDELKLEVPDLREDPTSLFAMVRDALPDTIERPPDTAQEYLDERLRGPRRKIYELVRRKTRNLLADRERLRFCRTRAFGSAKRMLRAMGRDLARIGAIENWGDVFMLRLEEVRGAFDGTISHAELPELVALRKRRRAADERLCAPSRFTTYGPAYWSGNLPTAGWVEDDGSRQGLTRFQGTASCPGIVEGTAVVTTTPQDVNGGILVAYRTDPGWVAALPSAAGLVIERGSPLTHVAIVARELRIPTVVQIKHVSRELRTGMRIRIDGSTGELLVLDEAAGDRTP